MIVRWTHKAQQDLARVYNFSLQHSRRRANKVADRLTTAADGLQFAPYIGVHLELYEPEEVRKLVIDDYEIHYQIDEPKNTIYIVDLWHVREDR
ncbi:type II toxin-antitoxin system RelE/ParE family toxin [Salmonella enterica subsp. enterica serovar Newport]|nr:type II toxin-antitoxin system RelE/ParE family toxin [Salmonella enterica subsp. enterica serovar Newport]EIP6020334.1 type II toxin-antitoxin system RelE/ParE family toxin [Salmonella enterica]EDE2481066.1 type II toxin-antitoxin system RelE/ParE family toxin [Salmonella enterica subsp. enterica serovar Newport]EDH1202444.1 type II toxin-antitoxin system RelE/ParE family toxin [Salmonella enterica subsp. enterica serovar Newport]EDH3984581.1 type II toxin-antitoxin system RelE/ParE family 